MKNLFDITEIASRAGVTNELCAKIVLGQQSHQMAGAINAMIVGTTHRAELEAESRELLANSAK